MLVREFEELLPQDSRITVLLLIGVKEGATRLQRNFRPLLAGYSIWLKGEALKPEHTVVATFDKVRPDLIARSICTGLQEAIESRAGNNFRTITEQGDTEYFREKKRS